MKITQLILPTDSFTLTTALSADEVKRRITENTERKKYESESEWNGLFKDRYIGFIKDHGFTMIQYWEGNNRKFEIQADGKLTPDASGTRVEIKTQLESASKTIGILLMAFALFFLVLGILVNLKENSDDWLVFFIIFPAIMMVFYVILVTTMFKDGNQKLKEFLIRILNAAEE
ncbi:MAG: hypothetical protein H3C39_03575 [Flavobacteriia bacterium]|nr:hypothetical protein [Flavobacteriia bacterium]